MKSLAILCMSSVLALSAHGQSAPPCQSTAHAQFDFWVGEWDLRWTDDTGREVAGFNRITKIHGGCAIREEFDGRDGTPLRGGSLSAFDARAGTWKQVWVDNEGGWIDFEGGVRDSAPYFARRAPTLGPDGWQRMVFRDIAKDSLTWDWERSTDGGQTWSLQWRIRYTRHR